MTTKLTTTLLFILSGIAFLHLAYLIYHGISWNYDFMMVVWYDALFIPMYLVGKNISKKNKTWLYNTMGVIGLIVLVWFTSQTYYIWSFDSFSLAMIYIMYGSVGSYIHYYLFGAGGSKLLAK